MPPQSVLSAFHDRIQYISETQTRLTKDLQRAIESLNDRVTAIPPPPPPVINQSNPLDEDTVRFP